MSETVTHPSHRCPRCGRQLPPDTPEGLCASCLLIAGAETLTGSSGETSTGVASTGDPSRLATPRLVDGQVWGPYRIVRLLGRGGMGEVYEAEQLETGRRLALKVLRDTLRGDDDRARFLREGQLAASISHAHTVYIFGSEEVDGAPAITMELLSGGTLKDRVSANGPMPPSTAASAVLDIIGGLDAAQAAGILHRNIKPSNCFVDVDGTVKVGDFGLSISTLTRDVRHELTTAGFEGTPQFAAPEQLRGEPLDVRADIYAVGATLYYLLTGRPPLDAPDVRALVSKVASEQPSSPRVYRREVPRGLAAVVLRCLAKAPADRPQSYAELADLLRPYGAVDDVSAPLGTRVMAWIVDSVIVSIATWLLVSSAWTVGVTFESATTLLRLAAWSWLVSVIYYLVLEGGWGASLGKRLMGLRVTSPIDDRWWLRVGLRTVVFHVPIIVPTLFFMIATGGSILPDVVYTANTATSGWIWNGPPTAWLSLLLTILLFSTARRGNGWTGVHELLSRTRVMQRSVVRPVASAAPKAPVELVPALSSMRRLGPYAVHTLIGETGGGRLFVGIDPILRRHVWIHDVTPGTPPVSAIRRDVSRAGRLYWLAGRRSATEHWDAFEAAHGEPLLSAPPTSDWREVHRSLSSLAIELDASVREAMDIRPTLAHVWKRSDGHLVLLDFPWPGLAVADAHQPLGPIELLAAVSARIRTPAAEPGAPLSATRLLNRLESGAPPALADVDTELARLASTPTRPSRIRRALPIALATMPAAVIVLAVAVILPSYARSLQGASPEQRAHLSENFPSGGEAIRRLVGSGFASIPVSISIGFGLMSVLAVPGGLVTRALRHAVVRRDGCEIGRVRSAVRFLIAWSPALVWIGCVGVPMFGTPHVSASVAFVLGTLAFLVMAAGAVWTIAIPARGPHDRIVGTWVVPR